MRMLPQLSSILMASLVTLSFASLCRSQESPAQDFAGQKLNADELIDLDLKFRILSPGKDWKLLDEDRIKRLVPDALAGAQLITAGAQVMGVVIAEMNTGSAEELFRLASEGMGLDNMRSEPVSKTRVDGEEALFATMRGDIDGTSFTYYRWGVQRGNVMFQLLCWHAGQLPQGKELAQSFIGAIRWDRGEIRYRHKTQKLEDTHGPGWLVRSGEFRSAVSRIRARAPQGWNLVVWPELEQLSADAEFALVHPQRDLYATASWEPLYGDHGAKRCQEIRATIRGNLGLAKPARSLEWRILGKKRQVEIYSSTEGTPLTFALALWSEGAAVHQFLCWHLGGYSTERAKDFELALRQVSFMDDERWAATSQELRGLPDLRSNTGADFSTRRGTFRDFAHQFVWRRPQRGYWQVLTGTTLNQSVPGARLGATELRTGLSIYVIPQYDVPSTTADEHHKAEIEHFVTNVIPGAKKLDRQLKMPGAGFHATLLESEDTGIKQFSAVITHKTEHRALLIFCSASLAALDVSKPHIEEAVRGFSFPKTKIEPQSQRGRVFTDLRLGMEYRREEGEAITNITPANFSALSTILQVKSKGALMIVGILDAGKPLDEDWFLDNILTQIGRNMQKSLFSTKPVRGKDRFVNREAVHFTWRTALFANAEALIARDGQRFCYTLLMGDSKQRRAMAQRVRLID
jgi:hypothetical protein